MLERLRRSQIRLDSSAPIGNRTTTMRRTRRLSFNIEANGFVPPPRTRRRRRRDPYFITYPPLYDPMQMGHQWGFDFRSNELPYAYGNLFEPPNRLDAGEKYEYDTVSSLPPEETCDTTKPQVVHELGDVLLGLDSLLQDKKVKILEEHQEKSNNTENNEDQSSSSQASHPSVLTDVMCEAIDRINNYIGNYLKQKEIQVSLNQINNLRGKLPAVQVFQLPVQPLIVQSFPPYPSFDSYPLQENVLQKKSHLERLPWLKERKRKRLSKSTTYVHMQNQGSSTEDLPKILEASSSPLRRNKLTEVLETSKKDAGTTMWCPRECCGEHCGALRRQEVCSLSQENADITHSLNSTEGFPPPCLKAPPPSIISDEEVDDHEEYYHSNGESMYLHGSPRTSSYRSSCDYRQEGGNLTYSYMEEEEQVDDDDWYRSASNKLAELEVEQDYYRESENEMLKHLEPNSKNSCVNIIATSDMAVSTTELNAETQRTPISIVRMCKTSSLKQQNYLRDGNQKGSSPGIHKVMFENVQCNKGVQVQPNFISTGTDPIRKVSISTISKVKENSKQQLKPKDKIYQSINIKRRHQEE